MDNSSANFKELFYPLQVKKVKLGVFTPKFCL